MLSMGKAVGTKPYAVPGKLLISGVVESNIGRSGWLGYSLKNDQPKQKG